MFNQTDLELLNTTVSSGTYVVASQGVIYDINNDLGNYLFNNIDFDYNKDYFIQRSELAERLGDLYHRLSENSISFLLNTAGYFKGDRELTPEMVRSYLAR